MKQFFLFFTIFLMSITAKAQHTLTSSEVTIDDNGTITACSYSFVVTDLIIPDSIQGQAVRGIGHSVFKYKGITSVSMDSVITVEQQAFYGNQLTSISLPIATSIESAAFKGNQLSSVNLPNVTFIGMWAFGESQITNINLPNAIYLEDYAFFNNQLTNISLPNVTYIGDYAFWGNQLTSINLPNVTSTGNDVFSNNQLSSISLPNVSSIGYRAFSDNQLTSISLPNLEYIDFQAFKNNQLVNFSLPSVTYIGENAFAGNPFFSYRITEHNNENFIGFKSSTNQYYTFGDTLVDVNVSYQAFWGVHKTVCDSYTSPGGNTWAETGVYDEFDPIADSVVMTYLVVNESVSITEQPSNAIICLGNADILSVTIIGTSPSYQWMKDGSLISEATNSSYSIPSSELSDQGMYSCEIENVCTSAIVSESAELKVIDLSVDAGIDQVFCNDTSVQLNTIVNTNHPTASGAFSYSWSSTTGLSDPSIANPIAQPLSPTTYSVILTDATGCSAEDNISLESITPANITLQPNSLNECINNNVSFVANASGTAPISYQWKKDGLDIEGANSSVFSLEDINLSNEAIYTCNVSNYCIDLTTNTAELKVIDLSVDAGADQVFCNDTSVQLNTLVNTNHPTASGAFSYSWSSTTGLSDPSIANPIAQPLSPTTYSVILIDAIGCTAEDNIFLESTTPASITLQPNALNECLNNNVSFVAEASGTAPISYQWKKDGLDIEGANSNIFSLDDINLSNEAIYTCNVSNYCIDLTSNTAELKVIDLSVDAGLDAGICLNNSFQIQVTTNSNHTSESGTINYTWASENSLNDLNISNPIANPFITTSYSVTATDENACQSFDDIEVFVQNVDQGQQLCLVSVDPSTGKNILVWEANEVVGTESYLIQKAMSSNVYSIIGVVDAGEASEFIDLGSDPGAHSDFYKITVMDTCGNVSDIDNSVFHKTINLTLSNVGNTMSLNWEQYEVEDDSYVPATYKIYRGTDASNMEVIDEINGMLSSYNDLNINQVYNYMVAAVREDCSPSSDRSVNTGYEIYSNQKNNEALITGMLEKRTYLPITLYPNPASTEIIIENLELKSNSNIVRITDVSGKVVKEFLYERSIHKIQINDLLSGTYLLTITGDKIYRSKFVKY